MLWSHEALEHKQNELLRSINTGMTCSEVNLIVDRRILFKGRVIQQAMGSPCH